MENSQYKNVKTFHIREMDTVCLESLYIMQDTMKRYMERLKGQNPDSRCDGVSLVYWCCVSRDYIKFANIFWQTYKLPNYILPTFILPTLHFTKLFLCKLTIYQTFSSKVTNSQIFSAKLFLSLILQIACTKSLIKMTYNS